MLFLLQIFCCMFCVMCMSMGLSQGMQRSDKDSRVISPQKKWDLSEQEFHFIIRILSIGLVDADPDILHHLKEYRDLHRISS
ncbi:hypothetical protein PGIGA_G00097050 [Pangasianodon gigas]|uniref:Uncharacterized protein n=1 Tax=Pangasianodon gigas TaxID=30993 RepID=A0ACC5XDW8_PANGG|nr:hypothetical protein [Pangasianodon gigas]